MELHRIAVISDTHGVLRPQVVQHIQSCEAVFHGGDMDTPEVFHRLQAIRPTYAVAGNADADWAKKLPDGLPQDLTAQLYGFRIYMIHNRKQIPQELYDYDIVIFGHSHKYQEETQGRMRYLNPGSCGRRRFGLPLTMMILTLYPGSHEITTEKIEISPEPARPGGREKTASSGRDMHKLVRQVMRDMDAGKRVADIALRNQADRELVEQICRMYATHPGVDVDGILDRLERRNL